MRVQQWYESHASVDRSVQVHRVTRWLAAVVLGLWLCPAVALGVDDVASMEGDPPVSGGHSDADLEVEIETALIQQTGVSLTGISVEVRNGVATLSGTVGSEAEREVAAAAAMKAGATGVENLLRIGPP